MRGAVFRLRAPRDARGHEQQGTRFAVVVQASRFRHMATWVVVPTSASARGNDLRPEIDFGLGPTRAMVDQLHAVDTEKRLGEHVGYVTLTELRAIQGAMATLFDLKLSDRPLPRGRRPQRPRRET